MDLGIKHVEILVPACGPRRIRFDPVDRVAVRDFSWRVAHRLERERAMGALLAVDRAGVGVVVVDGCRPDSDADNAELIRVSADLMVLDADFVVVVERDGMLLVGSAKHKSWPVEAIS